MASIFVVGNFVQACCWYVPHLPRPGETLVASAVHIEEGGKGLNVAICLQRLGHDIKTLIGCGRDVAGENLLALLERENISTEHVHQLDSASGWGSGWIADEGQNAIAVFPGANLLLTEDHVSRAHNDIAAADLVYGQFETALKAVQASFEVALKHNRPTVLNPSPWQAPTDNLRQTTHTVIVNETECQALLGMPTSLALAVGDGLVQKLATQLAAYLPNFWSDWPQARSLVITLGAFGCAAIERHQCQTLWHVTAPVITAVDTVGAGDAFASGYCGALTSGCNLQESLRQGNLCGAYVASKAGVLGVLPTAAILKELMESWATVASQACMMGESRLA